MQIQLDTYRKKAFGRLDTTVWDFWVAQKALNSHLAAPVLAVLCTPLGSAEVERSLRKSNKTSNNKFRGARMTAENKMKVNFLYANAGLKLQDLTLRQ